MITREKLKRLDKQTQFLFLDEEAEKRWEEFKKTNPEAIITYTRMWAKFMQYCIENGFGVHEVAASTSVNVGLVYQINGYDFERSIEILAECWKYGGYIQNWRNSVKAGYHDYDIVNPRLEDFIRAF